MGRNKGQQAGDFAKSLKPYLAGAFLIGEMSLPLNQCLVEEGNKVHYLQKFKRRTSSGFSGCCTAAKNTF